MPINSLRTPRNLLIMLALALAITSCGANPQSTACCPLSGNSTTCTCGSGPAACPVTPGPEFLYAYGLTGQIQAFSIDHNSGTLTAVGSATVPNSLAPGMVAVNNQFLFASDRSQSQLYGFSINQTTGILTALQGSPFSTGTLTAPSGLASPPNSSFLYAADVASIDAFSVNSSGVPSAISGSPFPSGSTAFLAADPSGEFLYATDADPPGSVSGFTIDSSTGALTAVPGSPFAIPGQTNGLPSGIVDTGSYVYSTLSLTNQIGGFSITSGTGALTPVSNSPFATGTNPTEIVFANGFLYVLNEGMFGSNASLSAYSIGSTGALTPLSGSPLAIEGTAIATDYFGLYLYVSGVTGIQAFSINADGTLTPMSGSPFAASEAMALTVVQTLPQ